ncbi:hypothetical protein Bca4012_008158 [Brassica carinata]|uniref:Uncharacterized protein n=2 Tax=Brassica TaxID=3705 RepID=A0A0D3BMT9_BRAOL|nr:unnamed protein product [Brassica napus]CDY69443.1 BnaCnng63510D [Brassica napus]
MLQRCITNGVMFHQAKVTNEVNSIVAEAIVRYLGSSNGLRGGHQLSAEVWRDLWPVERRRQREFFCFGMDILLKLDLEATRRFFDAFFDLQPRYWHGFLSSRLFLPGVVVFWVVSLLARF